MKEEGMVEFSVDPAVAGARIEPLLFGHNLEHTRSCTWRGLCSQLIRNRKFAGKPQQLSGAAMEWYRIGPPQTFLTLDAGDAYTRPWMTGRRQRARRHNNIHSQLVQGCVAGERCGIGQDGIPIEEGRRYRLRVAARGTAPALVAALTGSSPGKLLYAGQTALSDRWQVHRFSFTAGATDPAARLGITFEGVGEVRIGSVSLLDADSFHGMRPDVVALLKEIGCPILRWPGGNFAGDYRWQDGLLEPDMRPPVNTWQEVETLPHTFGFDFHEVGIDEFMALCREVGAEPFISLNLAWDRPEECAAWVEYCNAGEESEWGRLRIERGHREPYRVRYWSLGNELGYGHMEGPNSTREYAEKARACAEALRAADANLELVMSGEWRREEWFSKGLPPLAGIVDHIALHQYDRELSTYLGAEAEEQFARLAAAPSRTEQRLRDVRARLDAATPGKQVGISFDEWNVWYSWYRTPGVAEGIYAGGMLHALCRTAAEAGVTIGCYFEPVNEGAIVEGAIVVEPSFSRLTPVGQAFSLFKAHSGNSLVAMRGDGEGQVDGLASKDPATGRLVVTLVNRSPTEEAGVRLSFGGERPGLSETALMSSADFLPASRFKAGSLEVESDRKTGLPSGFPGTAWRGWSSPQTGIFSLKRMRDRGSWIDWLTRRSQISGPGSARNHKPFRTAHSSSSSHSQHSHPEQAGLPRGRTKKPKESTAAEANRPIPFSTWKRGR